MKRVKLESPTYGPNKQGFSLTINNNYTNHEFLDEKYEMQGWVASTMSCQQCQQ